MAKFRVGIEITLALDTEINIGEDEELEFREVQDMLVGECRTHGTLAGIRYTAMKEQKEQNEDTNR